MKKFIEYFGLTGGQGQPTRHSFSLALVWFPVIIVFIIMAAFYNLPYAGVPSKLAALNPQIPGGGNWIEAGKLSSWQVVQHWITYFLPYTVYFLTALLLIPMALGFYQNGRFTIRARGYLRLAFFVYLWGMLTHQILLAVTQNSVLATYGIEHGVKQGVLTGEGVLQVFVFAFLAFLDAAIAQGADLQEEADATI